MESWVGSAINHSPGSTSSSWFLYPEIPRSPSQMLCSVDDFGLCPSLNSIWKFSPQDCEKPGSFCLTVHCNLSALPREESRTIDLYMLLNTEILKKVSPLGSPIGVTRNPWDQFPMTLRLLLVSLFCQGIARAVLGLWARIMNVQPLDIVTCYDHVWNQTWDCSLTSENSKLSMF